MFSRMVGDATQESQTVYCFVCRSCGTKNTGWYQKCPNCGAVGKMEKFPKAEIIIESNDIPSKREEAQKRLERQKRFKTCPNCGEENSIKDQEYVLYSLRQTAMILFDAKKEQLHG